ncbi:MULTISPECIES: helix-turn-helix transcriptional regulator [unclassified Streptomyces]|uniref:helix-turn-helix transcriptional regulator n=1 Tax=unclassified Streptomyces TaxID=2593676 RepID=UPI00225AE254|nr:MULTISPECIES: helix-turn-helix transcriptional regulator [unclassified Streptomyces]MCX4993188.1 helix-turn-helix transcriptional regulator [Streptomyces sp. NBC_00568]MCX5009374.1 helix-turn-helix transcriptional regulator [Streptomyces sp. NBC_00638]
MCHPAWRRARIAAQHLRDLAHLRRVRDRIDRQYAQPLDLEALARAADMTAGHLSRQFRLAYGQSPYAYLTTRRIEQAMALLRRGDLDVTEVWRTVGCPSPAVFTARFTELAGMGPHLYARRAAAGTGGIAWYLNPPPAEAGGFLAHAACGSATRQVFRDQHQPG